MKRFPREGPPTESSKPEEEIAALIEIIVNQDPDILGVCEIGVKEDPITPGATLFDPADIGGVY